MKFGAHSQMFVHDIAEDPRGTVHRVAELGLDAIEVHVADPQSFPVSEIVESSRDCGVQIVLGTALPADRNTISDDPSVRASGLDHLRRTIEIAVAVGADRVCGGLHSANGAFVGRARSEQEWDRSVQALRAAAIDAEAADVVLAVEPVSRYSGYFLNTAEDALRLVAEVGSDAVQVQLDTWHMNIEEASLPEAIRSVGRHLAHIHLVESHRGVLGTGHVPWTDVFAALDEIAFTGLGVFEYFPTTLSKMAARSHTWRTLGTSDEVCARGVAALRRHVQAAQEQRSA